MVSQRTQELTSFIVMDVLEKANEMERQGAHIVHLEVGEPDFDAPACVKEAACQALANGYTHYTSSDQSSNDSKKASSSKATVRPAIDRT